MTRHATKSVPELVLCFLSSTQFVLGSMHDIEKFDSPLNNPNPLNFA